MSKSMEFCGKDKTIDKALQKAIQTAMQTNNFPDKMITYTVTCISGTYGGIAGLNEIEVTIQIKK